ncbi:Delta(12) fatty acid desaturase [Pseudomassariella vexata]|uniref:Delta(12) fatty acid desaturase n=1 Tax=Pseudomassariella vexata TaxID=1141098 RepID=A0A1Y2DHS0_9PEZI|nr:Delta(12) fatty acid desaturase [Pseudomassariella vexata]ORY58788.1 Delta(12) fatty acid desaturase [Pseudomassariella vexata]
MIATTTATQTVVLEPRAREKHLEVTRFPDVNTIRKAIPAYCFQPTVLKSMSYVVRDCLLAGGLIYTALTYIPQLPNPYYRAAAWAAYTFAQGLVGTGMWILAHECGHGAFSKHRRFNDFIGWVLHSALGVPYFSWKFTHARHHLFTGHMHKDMAFVPATIVEYDRKRSWVSKFVDPDMFEDAPIIILIRLLGHQLFAWPSYLLLDLSAGPESLQRPEDKKWYRLSHFDPVSPIFRPQEAIYVLITDLGLAIVGYVLYIASQSLGAGTVFLLWGVPYFWVHHWLIAITYLHHNHPDVKHYDEHGWTYVKGALATIDRDFGWIDRYLFHGIIGTHVVHHIFARIPFYYAEDATEAIKPVLGDLYHRDERSFYGQLWSVFTTCKYVEKDPQEPGTMKWHTE